MGINTAIIPYGQGIGFAIPIDLAREVVAGLQASGRVIRGFIGLGIQDLSPRLREALQVPGSYQGALVSHVMPGGPAARAGARVQDVVVSWNGRPLASHRAFMRAVAASPVGRPATLRVFREGRTLDLQVRVERRPPDGPEPASPPPSPPPAAGGRLGLDVAPLDDETGRELGTSDLAGLVIEEIRSGSPAAHSDLVPGDILRRVNQAPVASVEDLDRALRSARGETVALLVEREGSTVFVAVVR